MPGHALDRPRYLDGDLDLETVYRMLLEVSSELWVTRDRLHLLEAHLTRRRLVTEDELELLAFDAQTSAALEEDRKRFVSRLAGCVDAPVVDEG
ncbi:hypothetical protein NODU109028_04800 [Nocardioides dubius]|uniref:Uncharacterized protein n=1 Tax=Nocardioides dubius TaxID=317019 RepID=A0ABN1TMA8_9ACTN